MHGQPIIKILLTCYLNIGREPIAIALLKVVKETQVRIRPEFTRPVFLVN
jgi:hypothetical protein